MKRVNKSGKRKVMEKMLSNVEVIGIDHGWSMIKTASFVFTTGVKEIPNEPPMWNDVLEYEGRYYSIGEERLEVREVKTENDNYYLLTLAAMAKKLKRRGKYDASVYLAAGLPISRFGDEKKDFLEYLGRNKEVVFRFENDVFHVRIVHVAVFPQCYGAVADKVSEYIQKVVVVDAGSWTIDIMPIEKKAPKNSQCKSVQNGLIPCMRKINERCYRTYNAELDENTIQHYMMSMSADLEEEYLELMKEELQQYAEGVCNSLREFKIDLKTTKVVFVGGGAVVVKNFGRLNHRNISYILDIKANAKGFEYMGRLSLQKKQMEG